MAKQFESLSESQILFIENQKIFFIGTAAESGRVNVSPKGMDTLRVLGPNKVIWLNLTGSGNETAAHIKRSNRMTIMLCAFDGKPLILRLYGKAQIYHERDQEFAQLIGSFGEIEGARQIFEMNIELVQTSCGYAVPLLDFMEERSVLRNWTKHKGKEKIQEYWEEKNQKSIDGFETGIL